jgi:radical SAM protein with 4Fe4S-binding SPASM domain
VRATTSERCAAPEPFFLQWHITDRCNLRCAHCYRDAPKEDLPRDDLAAILENFLEFREDLPQEKTRIQFCGGEPFLSEHLPFLLEAAARHGIAARILSNGTLIDLARVAMLKETKCRIVQLSVEGPHAIHDAIRGPGTFEAVIGAARLLKESGIQVTLAMTLSRRSLPGLGQVLDLAAREADRIGFHRLVPCGAGAAMRDDLLGAAELRDAYRRIDDFAGGHPELDIPRRDPLWHAFFGRFCLADHLAGCSIGWGGVCIESNGDVYPCRRLPVRIGNALERPLLEIWGCEELAALRDRDRLKGRCGGCLMRKQCGGCRAVAAAVSGDPLAEDPQCFLPPSHLRNLTARAARFLWRKMEGRGEGAGAESEASGRQCHCDAAELRRTPAKNGAESAGPS